MNISTETREILRNYKAVINARRREMGQKPLTTAQIVDEICDFVVNQQAVSLVGHYILQASRNRLYTACDGVRLSDRHEPPDLAIPVSNPGGPGPPPARAARRQAAVGQPGPTPPGACGGPRQSPPNPLGRFRAVATVRCVKTRACSDRSGRAAPVAP